MSRRKKPKNEISGSIQTDRENRERTLLAGLQGRADRYQVIGSGKIDEARRSEQQLVEEHRERSLGALKVKPPKHSSDAG